jgi:hypothetical protein
MRSVDEIDCLKYATVGGSYYWVESWHGEIYYHTEFDPRFLARSDDSLSVDFADEWEMKHLPPEYSGAKIFGLMIVNRPRTPTGAAITYYVMSYWLLMALLLVPPFIWVFNRRQMVRQCRERKCLKCGYDLRHTPERCPECGLRPAYDTIIEKFSQEMDR